MTPESWLVVTVAAAFLLLGVAGSPLAWLALLQRRTRADRQAEKRYLDLTSRLRVLQDRLERVEASSTRTDRAAEPGEPALAFRGRAVRASSTPGRFGPVRTTAPLTG